MNALGISLQVVIEGYDRELDLVRIDEVTYDIEFHPAIVGDDGGGVLQTVDFDRFGGYLGNEIAFVGVGEDCLGRGGLGWFLGTKRWGERQKLDLEMSQVGNV